MNYRIYRLKDTEENVNPRFMGSKLLVKSGFWPVNPDAYEMIWEGTQEHQDGTDFLEWLFRKYNLDKPKDFAKIHYSLSVGDIVVLSGKMNGAYFCDNFGWIQIPEFYAAVIN